MTGYQKFWAAVMGALATAGVLVADGHVSIPDGIAIATSFLTALGVRQIINQAADG